MRLQSRVARLGQQLIPKKLPKVALRFKGGSGSPHMPEYDPGEKFDEDTKLIVVTFVGGRDELDEEEPGTAGNGI